MCSIPTRFVRPTLAVLLGLFALLAPACGGGAGGAEGAGRGLVLLSFMQDGVDNAVLNTRLEFRFSEAVNPATVHPASIQIREGDAFGATVPGLFIVQGASVVFEPRLASLCDQSDSGLKPATQYRVQCIGNPEEFAIRNMSGQPLSATGTYEFHTRHDNDPQKYLDQIPATAPVVTAVYPLDGEQAVAVADGDQIVIEVSENLDPCSVSPGTVRFRIHEFGDATVQADAGNGRVSGFSADGTDTGDTADQTPSDPYTWGAGGGIVDLVPPQVIPATIDLVQDFQSTQIVITPSFGKFPENALIVVELTFDIEDFGRTPLTPFAFSFTTENLPTQSSSFAMHVEGETPWDADASTSDIDTERSPSRVQGYMLFSGDGDNGADQGIPTLPQSDFPLCASDYQVNDGTLDDFDPSDADVLLDTGSTPNECLNSTDGSSAVVWEFASFRIRSGVTVRVVGVNPAVILVQGDAVIEQGGLLLVRGDGAGGSPRSAGRSGYNWVYQTSTITLGGDAVAGGGDGGDSVKMGTTASGDDGYSAYGSPDGWGVQGGTGAGEGGTHLDGTYSGDRGTAQGGGGGGHATAGDDATSNLGTGSQWRETPTRGHGGEAYPTTPNAERMLTPSAGSGAGAGGNDEWDGSYKGLYSTGGGSGGAGGGFVDVTSAGDIVVNGSIDAAGSPGGDGGSTNYYTGPGGGGGGAGGGIRLLTPNEIVLGAAAVITTAGGSGGNSPLGSSAGGVGPQNHGANGANGRVVLEDGDSVITGLSGATVVPGEGDEGFYRGAFDASRFKGGGLEPKAISEPFPVGPFDPTFLDPVQTYGTQEDFIAGVPTATAIGTGKTAILLEVRGYQIGADGTPDPSTETDWFTVGHFVDTAIEDLPAWRAGHPSTNPADPDYVPVPSDNALDAGSPHGNDGDTFAALNAAGAGGFEYLQVRITMLLPPTVGPFDPGPFIDLWTIRFTHDQ